MTLLATALRLPQPTTSYHVENGVRVPMRDGVELLADHYAPRTGEPAGTLLVRGPYGRGWPFSALFGGFYAARGYHVLVQSVRGTAGSGGDFEPFVREVDDGADTVAWLRTQPWFTGTFATLGMSYLGWTQWALLRDPPPELVASVITVGLHDVRGPRWGTGSFGLHDFLGWSDVVGRQEDTGRLKLLLYQLRSQKLLERASLGLPLGAASRALLGRGAPWFEEWLDHPDADDPFWTPLVLRDVLDTAEVPVLLLSGWQDLFVEQTVVQYERLHERGVPVGLTVGPWTHAQMSTSGASTTLRETLDWLGHHLTGAPLQRSAPVRVHVAGEGWRDLPVWPPEADPAELYLQPGHRLGDRAPEQGEAAFVYNPADPTPTIGGRLLSQVGGYRDDTALSRRADVLTFTGDALPADLCVVGDPVIELDHHCENPHNDLFVRLSQVDADGRSRNVSDAYLASAPSGPVRLRLDPVAHTFPAGSRLRVLVAGGSHPRFLRNLGTGEKTSTAATFVTVRHAVRLGAGSRLILPVSPAG
jgi:uncharacterized protein